MNAESGVLANVVAYHQATKHHFHRYAMGPGGLDWANQPDPFRRFAGAELLPLDLVPVDRSPSFSDAFTPGRIAPSRVDRESVSRLFHDSLALSAWKSYQGSTWALRVNPSSGNLHPTEGYLLCGPIEGLVDAPAVLHYAPKEHAMELRASVPAEAWNGLTSALPAGTLLVGLTSIHWREAWKYGERAYRYCQHDAGHAIAAVAIAAAGLGWRTTLLDGLGTDALATLLGIRDQTGPEAEHPDCILAVHTAGSVERLSLDDDAIARLASLEWRGRPNALSPRHLAWPIIDAVATEAQKPPTTPARFALPRAARVRERVGELPLRPILHARRSAVSMDGATSIDRETFYHMLGRTLPRAEVAPFDALPWRPAVHLGLFVHRVSGLEPGLYLLARDASATHRLRAAVDPQFEWHTPEGCPNSLALVRLARGDARSLAARVSCHQEIASDGAFSLGMIAEFEPRLAEHGPWFYPRLFWECGAIGQVLYLEAEAAGVRSTGIGCFFDDPVHEVFGLRDLEFQSLYHFTVGGAVEDTRLTSLPPYPHR